MPVLISVIVGYTISNVFLQVCLLLESAFECKSCFHKFMMAGNAAIYYMMAKNFQSMLLVVVGFDYACCNAGI